MLAMVGVTVTVTLLLPPFPPLGLELLLVLLAPLQPPNTIAVVPRKKRTLARRITHLIGHFPFFGLPCTSGRGEKCVPCAGLGCDRPPNRSLRAFLMDEAALSEDASTAIRDHASSGRCKSPPPRVPITCVH